MEVGQGPNWGCSAKEKKILLLYIYGRDFDFVNCVFGESVQIRSMRISDSTVRYSETPNIKVCADDLP
jgi:hypothetical protein